MADDPSFAPPLSELATSNLAPPSVTLDPAPAQGFSLDERASVPVTAQGGTWRMEYVAASINPPSTAAATAMTEQTATIPGLAVNDLAFIISHDVVSGAGGFIFYGSPVCTTAGQITVNGFNSDDAIQDPAATTIHFLVIHRFL